MNYRKLRTVSILGAAHYSPNVTLRGEIGASLVRKRIINGETNYIKGIQRTRNINIINIMDYSYRKGD